MANRAPRAEPGERRIARDPEIVRQAHAHAEATRPRQRGGPWSFTDAMARAPEARQHGEFEQEYRRAYAERLVELGLALQVGRSRTSGESGANLHQGYLVRAPKESRDLWARAAANAGQTLAEWSRLALTTRAAKQLGVDQEEALAWLRGK